MSILKRTSVFCQSVGGPPGTVKGQTQSVPRFEGDQEEGNRKLIVLQRAHGRDPMRRGWSAARSAAVPRAALRIRPALQPELKREQSLRPEFGWIPGNLCDLSKG